MSIYFKKKKRAHVRILKKKSLSVILYFLKPLLHVTVAVSMVFPGERAHCSVGRASVYLMSRHSAWLSSCRPSAQLHSTLCSSWVRMLPGSESAELQGWSRPSLWCTLLLKWKASNGLICLWIGAFIYFLLCSWPHQTSAYKLVWPWTCQTCVLTFARLHQCLQLIVLPGPSASPAGKTLQALLLLPLMHVASQLHILENLDSIYLTDELTYLSFIDSHLERLL